MDNLSIDVEAAIEACVEDFYAMAIADPVLGVMFVKAIPNLPEHLRIVRDFWSNALLGTARYGGSPYTAHVHLPIQPGDFDRWLSLFRRAARKNLPEPYADKAIARAELMTKSIRVGMFPFTLPDGRPSRTPA